MENQFPRAAKAKSHKQGGLRNGNLLSTSPGGQKSDVKVTAGQTLPEAPGENLCQASLSAMALLAILGVPWLVDASVPSLSVLSHCVLPVSGFLFLFL